LLSIAGPALGSAGPDVAGLLSDLGELLGRKNGFFAFESALHVLPSGPVSDGTMSVQLWNDPDLWRSSYGGMADGLFFFAEDIFGGQFAYGSDGIVSFDPETGEVERFAADLEVWADRVMADYQLLTGFPVAHSWQAVHGQLAQGLRLVPKKPFVLGGEFVPENLYALDAAKGMRFRGGLATQIRDLPEGASVSFKIVE
jgi:hypothetical protein